MKYNKILALMVTLFFALTLLQVYPTIGETTASDKSTNIMANTIGFDLAKYNVTLMGATTDYGSSFGPEVKQEIVDYCINASGTKTLVNLVFENGYLWYFTINTVGDKPLYTSQPSTSIIEQGVAFIQKYEAFAAQNSIESSQIKSMTSLLSTVSELKNSSITSNNIRLNLSTSTQFNVENEKLQWTYLDNGVEVPRKAVSLLYKNGTLYSFHDTWNLLTIGSKSEISQEDALNIAWIAAQKYYMKFGDENGTITEVKPDLTNVTVEVHFSMTTRNSTALFPLWQINYYFTKSYNGAYGIQVGIWGDTKEVFYCKSLSVLGEKAPEDLRPSTVSLDNPSIASTSSDIISQDGTTTKFTNNPTVAPTQETNLNTQDLPSKTSVENNTYLILSLILISTIVTLLAIGIGLKKKIK